MATTAAAYGCSAAAALSFPSSPFVRCAPPSRVSLASSNPKPRAPAPGLSVSYRRRRLYVSACSDEVYPDASAASPAEATFDIKLPRRSLLVEFTCNKCDARTKRLINRVAYERGTVFLQCAGCQVYHKFVDNLGLIVEYDLREGNEVEAMLETNPQMRMHTDVSRYMFGAVRRVKQAYGTCRQILKMAWKF